MACLQNNQLAAKGPPNLVTSGFGHQKIPIQGALPAPPLAQLLIIKGLNNNTQKFNDSTKGNKMNKFLCAAFAAITLIWSTNAHAWGSKYASDLMSYSGVRFIIDQTEKGGGVFDTATERSTRQLRDQWAKQDECNNRIFSQVLELGSLKFDSTSSNYIQDLKKLKYKFRLDYKVREEFDGATGSMRLTIFDPTGKLIDSLNLSEVQSRRGRGGNYNCRIAHVMPRPDEFRTFNLPYSAESRLNHILRHSPWQPDHNKDFHQHIKDTQPVPDQNTPVDA